MIRRKGWLREYLSRSSLFIRGVEVTGKQLVHGKHVHLVLLEHGVHFLVTPDLTLVVGIL
jgi:hypothetical protein